MSLASQTRSSPQTSSAEPRGRRERSPGAALLALAIAVPALVAGALTAYHLTRRSLWLDEAATVAIASQHGSALWHAIRHDGGNMLVYYLVLHELVGWFGAGEAVIRIPSVLADALAAGLTAALAWRLAGRRVTAMSAGLLTAVSMPLVYWGQDARGYAWMVALATGALLAFTVIVQSRGPAPRLAVLAYVLLTVLSLYVSFYAGLIILAELAVLPVFRHRARLVIGCLVLVAAACIPLAVLAEQRGSGQLFWVNYPTLGIVAKAGAVLISSGFPPNFHVTSTTIAASAVTVGLGLALGVWLLVATRVRTSAEPDQAGPGSPNAGWLTASWLIVPTAVMLVAAFAGEPVELARSFILLIPAVGVAFALGLHHRRMPAVLGVAGVALLLVMRALVLAPTYHVTPENWRAATAHLAGVSRAGDCVLFYPEDGRMPVDYYLRGNPATASLRPVLPTAPWSRVKPYVEEYTVPSAARLAQVERSCPRLFVIASHQGHRPGPAASERDLANYRRLLADLRGGYRHRSHRQFGYAAPIYVTQYSR